MENSEILEEMAVRESALLSQFKHVQERIDLEGKIKEQVIDG